MKPALILGIAGGSGSGKTTIVDKLLAGPHGEQIGFLPHDAYYVRRGQGPTLDSGESNFDHPDALDNDLYVTHVDSLLAGFAVDRPVYDFTIHDRSEETVRVEPRAVLLLEGILILAVPAIRERIDLAVYVETPADLRIMRRTVRDIEERGRTPRSIAEQYESTVRPMNEQFVEPSRYAAHIWVPWVTENPVAVDLLAARIAAAVRESEG